jgi:hypothetical protein
MASVPRFEPSRLEQIRASLRRFAKRNSLGIGLAEVVVGGALMAYGLNELGPQLAAKAMAQVAPAGTGAVMGGTAAAALYNIGGIGIAALGTAFAPPVAAIIGAGMLIFGFLGYEVGKVIEEALDPTWGELLASGGAAALGLLLVIDGMRRLRRTPEVQTVLADVAALTQRAAQALVRKVDFSARRAVAALKREWQQWQDYNATVLQAFKDAPLAMKLVLAPSALTSFLLLS